MSYRPVQFSADLAPSARARIVCVFPFEWPEQPTTFVRLHLDTTPDVRAAAVFERIDVLTPKEVEELGAKGPQSGALLLNVRNSTERPLHFVANLSLVPNEEAISRSIASHVDRDWAEAYDRALKALRSRSPN
jgi:hypothetical protein